MLKGKVVRNTLLAEKQGVHFRAGRRVTGGKNSCARHQDIPLASGPGTGIHLEALDETLPRPMELYRESEFTEAFPDLRGPARRAHWP